MLQVGYLIFDSVVFENRPVRPSYERHLRIAFPPGVVLWISLAKYSENDGFAVILSVLKVLACLAPSFT